MANQRIKKDCNGCKAVSSNGCSLGYKTKDKIVKGFEGLSAGKIPMEICPKPRTNNRYIELINIQ